MLAHLRITSQHPDLARVVRYWQRRHGVSGAVRGGRPGLMLLAPDTDLEALEELLRFLGDEPTEVELVWRPTLASPRRPGRRGDTREVSQPPAAPGPSGCDRAQHLVRSRQTS